MSDGRTGSGTPPGAPARTAKPTEQGSSGNDGYWCVICQRLLPNDDGVIVHDAVPHPDEMTFDEEDRPQ